jgi:L-arabinokinase
VRSAWRVEGPGDGAPRRVLPDVARFVETLAAHADFFGSGEPVAVTRAPGRLDLMGGIADYSGSLVLELPLAVATFVAAQRSEDARVTVRSLAAAAMDAEPETSVPLDVVAPGGAPLDYADARALLGADPRRQWAAYVLGALVVLGRERGVRVTRGVRLLVDSTVPAGKGVSSSAALEVAAMQAVCAAYDETLDARELALLCQMVENLVVGAPCGVMDQMTSAGGEQDRLLALLCQPAELRGHVALPTGLAVWGIDSGIRHAVGGADYGAVRVGAFMGYRILADLAGLAVQTLGDGRVRVADPRWGGYLANLTPSEWDARFRDAVPATVHGAAFLARYGGTTDPVTRVDPARSYAVRQPTAHPIHEHHRVRLFRALLESGAASEEQRGLLGELMYQSHASYGACGLGSDGTDRLVELVRAAGADAGLYGAKITGGGSGGVVAVLARREATDVVAGIAREYERATGRAATVLGGSSPGASTLGVSWARRVPSEDAE